MSDAIIERISQLSKTGQIVIPPVLRGQSRGKALLHIQRLNKRWEILQIDLCDNG